MTRGKHLEARDHVLEQWLLLQRRKQIYGTMCLAVRQATGRWPSRVTPTLMARYTEHAEATTMRDELRKVTGGIELAYGLRTLKEKINEENIFKPVDYNPIGYRLYFMQNDFLQAFFREYPQAKRLTMTHDRKMEDISDKQWTVSISRMWEKKVLDRSIVTSSERLYGRKNITTHACQIMLPAPEGHHLSAHKVDTIRWGKKTGKLVRESGFIVAIADANGDPDIEPAFGKTLKLALNRAKNRLFNHIAEKMGT